MLLPVSLCKIDKGISSTHFRTPSLSLCGETPDKPSGTALRGHALASAGFCSAPRVTIALQRTTPQNALKRLLWRSHEIGRKITPRIPPFAAFRRKKRERSAAYRFSLAAGRRHPFRNGIA